MMKLIRYLAALIALACALPAIAQTTTAVVVPGCGTPPTAYAAGLSRLLTQDVNGVLCTATTVADATSIFWNDATGTGSALGGAATFTGTARDVGVAVATKNGTAYFNASFLADQAGTAYVDASNDGSTWYTLASNAISAGSAVILTVPVMTRYHRARLINGSSAQTYLWINTAYSKG